jgi:hypothetical protein
MIVYIALHGEYGEGGTIDGVYTDIDEAVASVLSKRTVGWSPVGENTWRHDCDRAWVEAHEVK